LWNAAMTANPIGLIIVGIAALAGWITLIVNKWDDWGAAASLTLGALAIPLSIVMAIIEHWDRIVTAFTNGGMEAGIKAIGVALLDALLRPIQQIYELMSKIPGMASMADAARAVQIIRNTMANSGGIQVEMQPTRELVGPPRPMDSADQYKELMGRVAIDINNKSGFPMKTRSEGGVSINMKPESTFDNF
jgi:hypothetical protein